MAQKRELSKLEKRILARRILRGEFNMKERLRRERQSPAVEVYKMETKQGYKTTEFWLTLVATLVGAAVASGAIPETSPWAQALGLVSSLLAAAGYTAARSFVKSTEVKAGTAKEAITDAAKAAMLAAIPAKKA